MKSSTLILLAIGVYFLMQKKSPAATGGSQLDVCNPTSPSYDPGACDQLNYNTAMNPDWQGPIQPTVYGGTFDAS